MIEVPTPFRLATTRDTADVMAFFDMANDGLGSALWEATRRPGETAADVGARAMGSRIAAGEVIVTDDPGGPLAGLISGPLPTSSDPPPVPAPSPLHVIHGLRQRVPGTWFITTVAVRPEARGRGLGELLLGLAEDMAREAGLAGTSLLVLERNAGARKLYDRLGYLEVGRGQIDWGRWAPGPQGVLLLSKPL